MASPLSRATCSYIQRTYHGRCGRIQCLRFSATGTFLKTLVPPTSVLKGPWGLALAPQNFDTLRNRLLVGNVDGGTIHGFSTSTGKLVAKSKTRTTMSSSFPDFGTAVRRGIVRQPQHQPTLLHGRNQRICDGRVWRDQSLRLPRQRFRHGISAARCRFWSAGTSPLCVAAAPGRLRRSNDLRWPSGYSEQDSFGAWPIEARRGSTLRSVCEMIAFLAFDSSALTATSQDANQASSGFGSLQFIGEVHHNSLPVVRSA